MRFAVSSSRAESLRAIKVGDVIFGVAAGGQDKLLLVYAADVTSFSARHVTSQTHVEFARDGNSRRVEGGGSCTVVSTAKLPADEYDVAIGLDLKMRTGKKYPDFVLSKAEIQLLLTHVDFFKANPLPED